MKETSTRSTVSREIVSGLTTAGMLIVYFAIYVALLVLAWKQEHLANALMAVFMLGALFVWYGAVYRVKYVHKTTNPRRLEQWMWRVWYVLAFLILWHALGALFSASKLGLFFAFAPIVAAGLGVAALLIIFHDWIVQGH